MKCLSCESEVVTVFDPRVGGIMFVCRCSKAMVLFDSVEAMNGTEDDASTVAGVGSGDSGGGETPERGSGVENPPGDSEDEHPGEGFAGREVSEVENVELASVDSGEPDGGGSEVRVDELSSELGLAREN